VASQALSWNKNKKNTEKIIDTARPDQVFFDRILFF